MFTTPSIVLSILLLAAIVSLGWLYWEQYEKKQSAVMDPDDDQINQNVLQHDTVAAIPVRDTVPVLRPEPNAEVDLQIMNENESEINGQYGYED